MNIQQYFSTAVLLLAGLLVASCKKNYVETERLATSELKRVKVVKLQESKEPMPITASGVLASEKEIAFSFKIGGIIDKLNYSKGDYVKRGRTLAQLELVEINAQVIQAQNGFDKAERDLARVENLYQDSVATLEQKQDATTALEIAKADLDIAKFNKRYANIIAPMDGKILSKRAEVGELVSPGQAIYILGSSGQKGTQVIKVGVADKQIVRLKSSDKASITFSAIPGSSFEAEVTEIAEEANPMTGTFDVELTLSQFHSELKNGFVGYVKIFPSASNPHYKIPMTALIEGDGQKASIFTSKDQKTVNKRLVQVSEIEGDFFTINSQQIEADEWLIMEGGAYLTDKDSVIVIN